MNSRSRDLVRLATCFFCAVLGSLVPASGQDKQDPLAALFVGLPADLRANIGTNSVRRDRVNDWLSEHVDGKGKTVELRIPVTVTAVRGADKTYTVQFTMRNRFFGGEGQLAGRALSAAVTVLGDTWPILLRDGSGSIDRSGYRSNFGFVEVSTEDAEKLVELKEIRPRAIRTGQFQ